MRAAATLGLVALLAGCSASAQQSTATGAWDHSATAEQVCRRGYTATERAKDDYALRDRVYNAYGLRRGHRHGYVIDHLVPLENGGLTVEENLWPQTLAESYAKDRDENRLHAEICFGRMTVNEAAAEMLRKWGHP